MLRVGVRTHFLATACLLNRRLQDSEDSWGGVVIFIVLLHPVFVQNLFSIKWPKDIKQFLKTFSETEHETFIRKQSM